MAWNLEDAELTFSTRIRKLYYPQKGVNVLLSFKGCPQDVRIRTRDIADDGRRHFPCVLGTQVLYWNICFRENFHRHYDNNFPGETCII